MWIKVTLSSPWKKMDIPAQPPAPVRQTSILLPASFTSTEHVAATLSQPHIKSHSNFTTQHRPRHRTNGMAAARMTSLTLSNDATSQKDSLPIATFLPPQANITGTNNDVPRSKRNATDNISLHHTSATRLGLVEKQPRAKKQQGANKQQDAKKQQGNGARTNTDCLPSVIIPTNLPTTVPRNPPKNPGQKQIELEKKDQDNYKSLAPSLLEAIRQKQSLFGRDRMHHPPPGKRFVATLLPSRSHLPKYNHIIVQ